MFHTNKVSEDVVRMRERDKENEKCEGNRSSIIIRFEYKFLRNQIPCQQRSMQSFPMRRRRVTNDVMPHTKCSVLCARSFAFLFFFFENKSISAAMTLQFNGIHTHTQMDLACRSIQNEPHFVGNGSSRFVVSSIRFPCFLSNGVEERKKTIFFPFSSTDRRYVHNTHIGRLLD